MKARPHVLRRHLSLLVSGGLVLLIGLLGLSAGHAAGIQSREVHRADRSDLQQTLAGLVDTYLQLSAAEVVDHLERTAADGLGTWSTTPGDPATAARLAQAVEDTRVLDAGALLLSSMGTPLGSWTADGLVLPERDDPGWTPLRAGLSEGDGRLPLSGVLDAGDVPVVAMALPVPLSDGTTGLVVGLWNAGDNGLQDYVVELGYGTTGHGYIVDAAGTVVAGPDHAGVGGPLPLPSVLGQLGPTPGLLDTVEDETGYVTSFAPAGRTGWTALTAQHTDEFEGALRRSSQVVQVAVVALLVIAGAGLVVLHRTREATLRSVALRDELTGVWNRRGWFALAEHELARAQRQGQERVLLFIDLDGLKQVNDVLGHREGDRAIVDAARVLTAASRSCDLVGRLGGDEFVLLLGEGGRSEVAGRRVAEALGAHNAASDAGFELRLSLGAELWRPDAPCGVDELVRRADAVMYVDKTSRPARHDGVLRVPGPRVGNGVGASRP